MEENKPSISDSNGTSPMGHVYGYNNDSGQIGKSGNNNQSGGFKKTLVITWDFLKILAIAALIVLPIRYFIFQPFIVKGDSMVPNLHSGDYLIVDEISYVMFEPQRGDIVVLDYPLDESQRFIKRVIGLPGETVSIQNGTVKITKGEQGVLLDEKKYLANLTTEGNVKITLGSDEYFVMGDNRQFSYDSRKWGVLPKKDIIGKAVLRLFPIQNITFIQAPSY